MIHTTRVLPFLPRASYTGLYLIHASCQRDAGLQVYLQAAIEAGIADLEQSMIYLAEETKAVKPSISMGRHGADGICWGMYWRYVLVKVFQVCSSGF
jgi:hypothetical protein